MAEAVQRALDEDRAREDATSKAVVPAGARARARIVARAPGVLAGCAYAEAAFHACDPDLDLAWQRSDGDTLASGDEVVAVEGRARAILAAERTALNFLQQLSGVATATAEARKTAGATTVMDTRKTTPGLRDAEKAAVAAGGGRNHRRDLAAELLLKENHFALSGADYRRTVLQARAAAGARVLGVESCTLEEARAALAAGADYVLLDNFTPAALATVVKRLRQEFPEAVLEASGGVTPASVAGFVRSGVDRVSLGWLTHSAPALDLALLLDPLPPRTAAS